MANIGELDIIQNVYEDQAQANRVMLTDISGNLTDANDIRFDPNDSAPDYIGTNETESATTSDIDWLIYKFTYSGSDVTRIQKKKGSWDGRVALFP